LRGVDVRAGSSQILHGVNLELRPGELCGLIGPSGAGKSTLIKVLLGLRKPAAGEARIGGGPVTDVGPIGYVPQDDALHSTLTVAQTLHYASALRMPGATDAERQARIDQVCLQVDLSERLGVRVAALSGGQRKRVSVALELLTRPPVLILDEPTSGLDPGLEARTMELFQQVARSGRIVLVATHAMQSLARCDALLVLVAGRVAYFGPPDQAAAYFRTERFAGIFDQLPKRKPGAWGKAWNTCSERTAFASRARPALGEGTAPAALPVPASEASAPGETPPPESDDPLAAARAELARLKAAQPGDES
jgi:ABC transport system ATP-binding/permease protein